MQALVASNLAASNVAHHDIIASTSGVLYFGTPHMGSGLSSLHRVILNISSLYTTTSTTIVQHLERDSEYLMKAQSQYNAISVIFTTISFYEEYPTDLPAGQAAIVRQTTAFYHHGLYRFPSQLVSRSSAVLPGQSNANPVMLHKNHVDMVKFSANDDADFNVVLSHITRIIEEVRSTRARFLDTEAQGAS